MRSLTYRTGARSSRRERRGKRIKGSILVEPTPKRRTSSLETSDPAMRKKVYLMFKNPLRGSYYYLKRAKGRCKIGAERSAHGMRWNYYMRRGKCIPRIAPSIFSRSLLVSTGIMRSLRIEREGLLLRAGSRKKNRDRKGRHKTTHTDERFSSGLRHKSPGRKGEGGSGAEIAKVIPINVHPEYRLSHVRQPVATPAVRKYVLKRTATSPSSRLPKARSRRVACSTVRGVSHSQPKNSSAARIEGSRMRLSAEAKAAKSMHRKKKRPAQKTARHAGQKGNVPRQAKTPGMPASSAISQQTKTPGHVGYISSGEKRKVVQLKVAQTDPKPPR